MFEFITISNGAAVVQHGATGHVYRFRPTHAGVWNRLTLDKVDVCQDAGDRPESHERAALAFAEEAAEACCRAAAGVATPPRSAMGRQFRSRRGPTRPAFG